MTYWCYILQNIEEKYKNRFYIGFTVDPIKRLRQHNKEIKGGAKSTRIGKWKFVFLMTGFKTINNALSCEWRLKHPDGKPRKNNSYQKFNGKIKTINEIILLEKWTKQCDIDNNTCDYLIFLDDKIYEHINKETIPSYIGIISVENVIDVFDC